MNSGTMQPQRGKIFILPHPDSGDQTYCKLFYYIFNTYDFNTAAGNEVWFTQIYNLFLDAFLDKQKQ